MTRPDKLLERIYEAFDEARRSGALDQLSYQEGRSAFSEPSCLILTSHRRVVAYARQSSDHSWLHVVWAYHPSAALPAEVLRFGDDAPVEGRFRVVITPHSETTFAIHRFAQLEHFSPGGGYARVDPEIELDVLSLDLSSIE